jgi:hypothetical protein
MGNLTNGTVCCVKTDDGGLTCCAKDGEGKGAEIVRSRPVGFPGLGAGDKLAEHTPEPAKYQVPDPNSGLNQGDEEETYDDGSTYLGQLISGKRHGYGVWTSPAEQYTGQWKHDHRDGQGRQTWQDGRVYEGQFQEGKFDGRGRMEWHTPQGLMVYDGEYVNDVKHGQGKYIWPDGRVYDGEWSQGKRWGKATYVNSGGERREGIWRDDKLEKWCDQPENSA